MRHVCFYRSTTPNTQCRCEVQGKFPHPWIIASVNWWFLLVVKRLVVKGIRIGYAQVTYIPFNKGIPGIQTTGPQTTSLQLVYCVMRMGKNPPKHMIQKKCFVQDVKMNPRGSNP